MKQKFNKFNIGDNAFVNYKGMFMKIIIEKIIISHDNIIYHCQDICDSDVLFCLIESDLFATKEELKNQVIKEIDAIDESRFNDYYAV